MPKWCATSCAQPCRKGSPGKPSGITRCAVSATFTGLTLPEGPQAGQPLGLVLQGHTDVRGGSEYNLSLGQKRAEAVRQSLQLLGVEPRRMEAVSYGKEQLASPGKDEAAHQRNRRVEFNYR